MAVQYVPNGTDMQERGDHMEDLAPYFRYLKRTGLDSESINHYRLHLHAWFSWLEEHGIDDPSPDDAMDWIDELMRTRMQVTVRNYASSCRAYYTWASANGRSIGNPFGTVHIRKTERLPRYVTEDEMESMLAACDLTTVHGWRRKVVISLLWDAGLRASELCSLRVRDVDLDHCTLRVIGKGRRERIAFFTDRTRALLDTYLRWWHDGSEWLVPGDRGPINRHTVQYMVAVSARDAGIKKHVHPHMLRHGIATHLLSHDMDIRLVQEILGHASLSSTQVYTHIARRDLESKYRDIMGRGTGNRKNSSVAVGDPA